MRKTFKRIVAAMLAAVTIGTPSTMWAGEYCSTGAMVKSHATGGDYIAGILVYETMGTVTRSGPGGSSTTTTSTTGQVGVPGTGASGTITTSQTTVMPTTVVTTQEPIGIYAMNDGSLYEIDCATGQSTKIRD
jgi:hypothetical protein